MEHTGGDYLSFVELRDVTSSQIAATFFSKDSRFGSYCSRIGLQLQKQPASLDMTKEAFRFLNTRDLLPENADPRSPSIRASLLDRGVFYLSEGKTFHQFDESWGETPRYCVPLSNLDSNPLWVDAGRFFRLAFRAIASSTNERTSIFCILSPGTVSGNSVAVERDPSHVARAEVLYVAGVCNTYSFDWILRVMTGANVNLFIMNNTSFVTEEASKKFVAHSSLRLTCNHSGYEPLWQEQLGDTWRETDKEPVTWPVISGDDKRWNVRGAIDAIVADAYGLSRDQYIHVLSTFSHTSYPKAPELCLAKFDELKRTGVEAFTKKHDPYWNIPLNATLPEPVIDIPIAGETSGSGQSEMFGLSTHTKKGRRKAK